VATGKPQFAALPLRAVYDERLTDRDLRILAAVAAHDRMSSVRGTGQGAWASHRTMAAMVGANYSRFSVAIHKLLRLGYLTREKLPTNRRRSTYRIIYTDQDRLPSGKRMGIPCADRDEHIVCSDPQLTSWYDRDIEFQDIPQSGEINSAEAWEGNAAKATSTPTIWVGGEQEAIGLARLERALKSGDGLDRLDWFVWLENAVEDESSMIRGWAGRLEPLLLEAMTEEEFAEAQRRSIWGL
jgi:hypothetical protein